MTLHPYSPHICAVSLLSPSGPQRWASVTCLNLRRTITRGSVVKLYQVWELQKYNSLILACPKAFFVSLPSWWRLFVYFLQNRIIKQALEINHTYTYFSKLLSPQSHKHFHEPRREGIDGLPRFKDIQWQTRSLTMEANDHLTQLKAMTKDTVGQVLQKMKALGFKV